jgi:hypothetical protein
MKTFDIRIKQAGRVVCFSALARSSMDALRLALDAITEGVAFGIVVRSAT